ncbi:MAG TPA: hypothetical protein PL106_13985, partial [Flavobacteriales bacterium]|nr:hypothetical protein [Flavobacteriales bacterium]
MSLPPAQCPRTGRVLRCSCLAPARIASGSGVCSFVAASSPSALLGRCFGKLPLRPLTRCDRSCDPQHRPPDNLRLGNQGRLARG